MDRDKYLQGAVSWRRDLSDDLWLVRVRHDGEIPFRAGQYVTVGLEQNGHVLERPYSIVSAPSEPELELFLELVPEGHLTRRLHPLGTGAPLLLRPKCKGVFLREAPVEGQAHLFVCTVTGVAPFVSLLRSLGQRHRDGEPGARVALIHGASRSHEFGYLEEMRALEAEMDWFSYIPTVSRPWEDPEWAGETGRVDDVLRKHADALGLEPGEAGVYLCGHPAMIATTRGIMERRGFDREAIREEQFWPA